MLTQCSHVKRHSLDSFQPGTVLKQYAGQHLDIFSWNITIWSFLISASMSLAATVPTCCMSWTNCNADQQPNFMPLDCKQYPFEIESWMNLPDILRLFKSSCPTFLLWPHSCSPCFTLLLYPKTGWTWLHKTPSIPFDYRWAEKSFICKIKEPLFLIHSSIYQPPATSWLW